MTQETYRLAYDEANSELKEILSKFEELQLRREKIQQVVDALKPLLADGPMPEAGANASGDPAPLPGSAGFGCFVRTDADGAGGDFPRTCCRTRTGICGRVLRSVPTQD